MAQVSRYSTTVDDLQAGSGLDIAPDGNSGHFFNGQRRETAVYELGQSWSALEHDHSTGDHMIKTGADLLYADFTGVSRSAPVTVHREDGTISRRFTYDGPASQAVSSTDIAAYLQDRWQPVNRILIEGGARVDRDGVLRNTTLSVRGGGALTLTDAGTFVLRAGTGRFVERTPSIIGAFQQFERVTDTRFAFDGVSPIGAPVTWTPLVSGSLEPAHSIAWNASIERTMKRAFWRLSYLARSGRREFILNPVRTGSDATVTLSSDGHSTYREIEIAGRASVGPRLEITGSYVHSHGEADLNGYTGFFGTLRAPFVSGNDFTTANGDVPNRLVARIRFAPSVRWLIAPVIEFRNGIPYSPIDDSLDIIPQTPRPRFPDVTTVDFTIERFVKVLKWRLWLGVRVYNALDSFAPTDVQRSIASPRFGSFYGSQPPRIWAQVRFP
jgi:hypothetical protein